MVYLIRFCGPGSQFKIGHTSKPVKKRLTDLQVGCPFELYVEKTWSFASVRRARQVEQRAHKVLKLFRIRGSEWFSADLDLCMAAIEDAKAGRDTIQPTAEFSPGDAI